MGYLSEFGFKIYRLREVKQDSEILIYDIERRVYNTYSLQRSVMILEDEFKHKKIELVDFISNLLQTTQDINVSKTLKQWILNELTLIDNFGYKPIEEEVFWEEDKQLFNIYKKSKLLRDIEIIKKPDFPLIKQLLNNLVSNNEEEYNYFVNWLAWQIQNPLQRLPTSIILQGEHGTGKTKFCELILKPIFESNFCEIGQSDINKDYNDYIMGKQLIVANEVIHNDNKFLVPDKLKNYVTDEFLSINRKFKDTIYIRNYSQWIFVTNNQIPLKIEQGDRRYNVFESKKLVNGRDLITNLIKNHEQEILNFTSHLLTLDVKYSDVDTPLENQSKTDLIKASFNSVQEFYHFVMDDLGGLDKIEEEWNFPILIQKVDDTDTYYIFTNDLFKAYSLFCEDVGYNRNSKTHFTRSLKQYGLITGVQKGFGKSQRVLYFKK